MTVNYALLDKQLEALIDAESDLLAISANFVGLLFTEIDRINWLGLYIARQDELVLGPFQGLPACVRIPFGKGVCGTAAAEKRTVRVSDVHAFDGHIACDVNSQSEIVIPLIAHGEVFAVLDIDSPQADRFSVTDQEGCEMLCDRFVRKLLSVKDDLNGFI